MLDFLLTIHLLIDLKIEQECDPCLDVSLWYRDDNPLLWRSLLLILVFQLPSKLFVSLIDRKPIRIYNEDQSEILVACLAAVSFDFHRVKVPNVLFCRTFGGRA